MHRFEGVYDALDIPTSNVGNTVVLNLRGHGMPLYRLSPETLDRCDGAECATVAIGPIHKVKTGDENTVTNVMFFVAWLDVITDGLGCRIDYAHHHSKSRQG